MTVKIVWMISWHKDANLLACCTDEGAVKIYDIREGTVVQASDDWYSKSKHLNLSLAFFEAL